MNDCEEVENVGIFVKIVAHRKTREKQSGSNTSEISFKGLRVREEES